MGVDLVRGAGYTEARISWVENTIGRRGFFMKKEQSIIQAVFLMGVVTCVVAAPAKNPTDKPMEKPEVASPKSAKIGALVIEDFEQETLTGWQWNTRELKDQPDGTVAFEETRDDKIAVLKTKEKKLVLKGKSSLQIVYEPGTDSPKKEVDVWIKDTAGVMGERDALRLIAVALEGKGTMTVHLIDVNNTDRYSSQQPIECTFRKPKTLTLDRAHFGVPEKNSDQFWKDIKRVQFVLHGAMTLVIDQLEFVSLPKK